ncbi:DUF2069 domain-containing protein [Teredinibacter franksiae]|jgi:Predicted membrane protein|uniref:DUF2069 domain-containing protein n=1 Tax=Teredinibacter franksiae TaxID=2761453 RepID=UPI0016289B25|nr:DUF2069 domain-containing protein [Teredinibacter franksiae]
MSEKAVKPIAHLAKKTRYSLWATGISYAALFVLFLYWNFTRTSGINWVVLAAQSLPLLLLLPGLAKKYYRSYSWLCFLLLIYFVMAVDGIFMSTRNWSDAVFVGLTVTTFISAMLAARWLQRSQKGTPNV